MDSNTDVPYNNVTRNTTSIATTIVPSVIVVPAAAATDGNLNADRSNNANSLLHTHQSKKRSRSMVDDEEDQHIVAEGDDSAKAALNPQKRQRQDQVSSPSSTAQKASWTSPPKHPLSKYWEEEDRERRRKEREFREKVTKRTSAPGTSINTGVKPFAWEQTSPSKSNRDQETSHGTRKSAPGKLPNTTYETIEPLSLDPPEMDTRVRPTDKMSVTPPYHLSQSTTYERMDPLTYDTRPLDSWGTGGIEANATVSVINTLNSAQPPSSTSPTVSPPPLSHIACDQIAEQLLSICRTRNAFLDHLDLAHFLMSCLIKLFDLVSQAVPMNSSHVIEAMDFVIHHPSLAKCFAKPYDVNRLRKTILPRMKSFVAEYERIEKNKKVPGAFGSVTKGDTKVFVTDFSELMSGFINYSTSINEKEWQMIFKLWQS